MSQIESLPPEILHGILQWVEHDDMATLPRVSRTFHSFIKGNKRLFKYVYLHNLVCIRSPQLKCLDLKLTVIGCT